MTRRAQEICERQYLNAFLPLLGLADMVPKKLDPPRPDFCIFIDHKSVGVEITEYHSVTKTASGHTRRQVEQEWECLRKKLMCRVDQTPDLQGVHATLMFKGLRLPSSQERSDFISQLIEYTKKHVASLPLSVSGFEHFPILSRYLNKVRLRRFHCYMSWDWNGRTAWIGTDQDAFMKCIQKKADKRYDLTGLDEIWLLVVSEPYLSQTMWIKDEQDLQSMTEVNKLLRCSAFHKVYLFQYLNDVAYEWPAWRKIEK